jgi:hypothetical protein
MFTTVMQWDSYPGSDYDGVHYGMKSDSFGPYFDLPGSTCANLALAVGGTGAPRAQLAAAGWAVIDPLPPTRDPWKYQEFIAASKAEFSVAKQGYVVSCSGWFSERSVAYLASGRPVVVEDTGFSRWLDAGSGVLPFRNRDEAVAAIAAVDAQYVSQCRAARAVAEKYFDARVVLSHLVERAMANRP